MKANFFKLLDPGVVLAKVEKQMEEARVKIEDFRGVRAALLKSRIGPAT